MTERGEHAIARSTGNVFEDLELPDPSDLLPKARLVSLIAHTIESRGLTQAQAAALLGTTQPVISNLSRGLLSGFSIDRLLRFLNALGHDVEIRVRGRGSRPLARTTVDSA
jgi:predicted XRE-type DNA-binding protein